MDADSRNIEELKVTRDEDKYKERVSAGDRESLEQDGIVFSDYKGMMKEKEK